MPSYKAAIVNVTAVRGDYFERGYDIGTSPYSLIGKTLKAQVRDKENGKILLTFTTTDASILVSGTVITINCDANEIKLLKTGVYVWDMIAYTSAADEQQIMKGTFTITDKITSQA